MLMNLPELLFSDNTMEPFSGLHCQQQNTNEGFIYDLDLENSLQQVASGFLTFQSGLWGNNIS